MEKVDRLGNRERARSFARAFNLDFDFHLLFLRRTGAQGRSSQFADRPAEFSAIGQLSADVLDIRQLWLDVDRCSCLQTAKAAVQLRA